jgi:hypothetical protein
MKRAAARDRTGRREDADDGNAANNASESTGTEGSGGWGHLRAPEM